VIRLFVFVVFCYACAPCSAQQFRNENGQKEDCFDLRNVSPVATHPDFQSLAQKVVRVGKQGDGAKYLSTASPAMSREVRKKTRRQC
jgi:hypothetical protein